MEFARRSVSQVRRRRLLNEGFAAAESETVTEHAPDEFQKSNVASATPKRAPLLMEKLPRVIDLVPQRLWTYLFLMLLGVAIIAGLEAAYWYSHSVAHLTSDGSIETFNLDAEGTLAVWFSSFSLSLAGFVALLIYSIRKRKIDDYRARYRVWFWAALCWFMMSLDETASLHEGFKELMAIVAGTRIFGDGSAWWVIAYLCVLVPVAIGIWFDMKHDRVGKGMLVGTACCFVIAILAQLDFVSPLRGMEAVMLEEGAEMLGDWLLLLGMTWHAKFLVEQIAAPPLAKTTLSKQQSKSKEQSNQQTSSEAKAEAASEAQGESSEQATATKTPRKKSTRTRKATKKKTRKKTSSKTTTKTKASSQASEDPTANATNQSTAQEPESTKTEQETSVSETAADEDRTDESEEKTNKRASKPANKSAKTSPQPEPEATETTQVDSEQRESDQVESGAADESETSATVQDTSGPSSDDSETKSSSRSSSSAKSERYDDPEDLLEEAGGRISSARKRRKGKRRRRSS